MYIATNYFLYQCIVITHRNYGLCKDKTGGFGFDVSVGTIVVFVKNNFKPEQKSLKQFSWEIVRRSSGFNFIISVSLNDLFRRWIIIFLPES